MWHIQLVYNVWVLWGYGPRNQTIPHVDNAAWPGEISFGFTLPTHKRGSGLKPARFYETKLGWGWQYKSNDGMQSSEWAFADTREQAIADAYAAVDRAFTPNGNHPQDIRPQIKAAIREKHHVKVRYYK